MFFIILLVFLCNESSSCKATIMAQAKLCKSFVMDSWIISTTMIISLLTFFMDLSKYINLQKMYNVEITFMLSIFHGEQTFTGLKQLRFTYYPYIVLDK